MAAIALLAGGCSVARGPSLEFFDWEMLTFDDQLDTDVDALGVPGGIMVSGTLITPSACAQLTPRLRVAGDRLTLTVEVNSVFAGCGIQGEGAYRYDGVITRVRSGTYQITVTHTFPGTSATEETFTLAVSVP
jgi:hypothetical protein